MMQDKLQRQLSYFVVGRSRSYFKDLSKQPEFVLQQVLVFFGRTTNFIKASYLIEDVRFIGLLISPERFIGLLISPELQALNEVVKIH